MTKPGVRFEGVLEAMEFVSSGQLSEHEAFLCRQTGQVHYHSELSDDEPLPEDIDSADKYLSLPHKNDLGLGKPLVLKFASELMPEAFGEIQGIFNRAGAYARFKEFVMFIPRRDAVRRWDGQAIDI